MKTIYFLVGPTAVGKTAIAMELAGRMRAEIISCDSMQVYKGMDIGTQKPPARLRKKIRHHMIDIISPSQEFNAAEFCARALKAIREIHRGRKAALFVGGTGLYMKALLNGLFPSPPKDQKLRERLYGHRDPYGLLQKIDPQAAQAIHPNDTKKIVRSLEVYYTTGTTISELKAGTTKPLADMFDVKVFGLTRPRQELYERVERRVERMFKDGFMDEVKRLSKKKLGLTASQAIGYREVFACLRGDMTLDETKEAIKKNTRRYAKRQLTWFRADTRVQWIEINKGHTPKQSAKQIFNLCNRFKSV